MKVEFRPEIDSDRFFLCSFVAGRLLLPSYTGRISVASLLCRRGPNVPAGRISNPELTLRARFGSLNCRLASVLWRGCAFSSTSNSSPLPRSGIDCLFVLRGCASRKLWKDGGSSSSVAAPGEPAGVWLCGMTGNRRGSCSVGRPLSLG